MNIRKLIKEELDKMLSEAEPSTERVFPNKTATIKDCKQGGQVLPNTVGIRCDKSERGGMTMGLINGFSWVEPENSSDYAVKTSDPKLIASSLAQERSGTGTSSSPFTQEQYENIIAAGPETIAKLAKAIAKREGVDDKLFFYVKTYDKDDKITIYKHNFSNSGQSTVEKVSGGTGTRSDPFTPDQYNSIAAAPLAARVTIAKAIAKREGVNDMLFFYIKSKNGELRKITFDDKGIFKSSEIVTPEAPAAPAEAPAAAAEAPAAAPAAAAEAPAAAPAAAARPRPVLKPRADVKQLQQLLNRWFASSRNKTDVESLAPSRRDPKGEDGIYGEDTKAGVDIVLKDEGLGSRKQYSIQQMIKIIQELLSEPVAPTSSSTPSQGPEVSPLGPAALGARGAGAPAPQQESKILRGMILKEILAALK